MTTDPSHQRTRRIEIPEHTAEAIADRLPMTDFESVDDYATFALGRLLRELEREHPTSQVSDSRPEKLSETGHEDGVEERLESLGYL